VRSIKINKVVRIAVILAAVYLLAFGIAMAFWPIRPFWNDEWRLIYNIKFKSVFQLWGTLDLLQECPRAYLTIIKWISAAFDYSYTALRLPPLIISIVSIFFIFHLRKRFYPENTTSSYLFVLIFISSQTFTDYVVQVKQYEMDILLSLLALWQLSVLLNRNENGYQYALLCISFLLAPYLSYTYPINVAPIFPVAVLFALAKERRSADPVSAKRFSRLLLPLLLAIISIAVFYVIDVRHMMADKRMYVSYQKAYYNTHRETFIEDVWNLFALVGSGFVFELIFGLLGIAAVGYGVYRLTKKSYKDYSHTDYFHCYALVLIAVILGLFATGKLIGGVARLTAYSVPAISMLIISMLDDLHGRFGFKKVTSAITAILVLGLLGNIISSCINVFTYSEYKSRIATYRNTEKALTTARLNHIPFMATDGVCGDQWHPDPQRPGIIQTNTITPKQIEGADTLCAEVITKVNPGYKVWDTVKFYYMPDDKWISMYVKQVPASYKAVVAGNGILYKKYIRPSAQ